MDDTPARLGEGCRAAGPGGPDARGHHERHETHEHQQHHEHHEHRPSPRLAQWVERAVGYRLEGYPGGVHVGMPAGSLTFVVPFDEPLCLSDPVARVPRAFRAVVAGLASAPAAIHHDGRQHGLQLALRPAAARTLLGCRAGELAGTSFELADVIGPRAAELRDRAETAGSWPERFAVVEEVLGGLEREAPEPRPEVDEAWRLIRDAGGLRPVHQVAASVGWSVRRLQEQFRAEFGLTPKGASRVRRFERSLPLVAAGRLGLTEVAVRCGWSDHAHMDRDWRDLAGTSPTRWRADDVLATA